MIVSRIPYRETEDYIADSVAVLALESYENQSKDIFSLCDLGCGNGIVLHKILNQLNSSEIEREIKVHLIDIDHQCIDQTLEGLNSCLLYTSPSPRDAESSRMPSSA